MQWRWIEQSFVNFAGIKHRESESDSDALRQDSRMSNQNFSELHEIEHQNGLNAEHDHSPCGTDVFSSPSSATKHAEVPNHAWPLEDQQSVVDPPPVAHLDKLILVISVQVQHLSHRIRFPK